MFADPDLLMVLAQQLTTDDVTVFSHNAYQPVDIFCVLTNQFGQLCHLVFKMF